MKLEYVCLKPVDIEELIDLLGTVYQFTKNGPAPELEERIYEVREDLKALINVPSDS